MSGLTSTGFVPETLESLREGLNNDWRAQFGASVDVSDESPDGVLLGIVAERLALCWEVLEQIVTSQDPDGATDTAQDALCALSGTVRLPAKHSTVVLTLTGDNATVVPIGSLAETATTKTPFQTLADATLATLTAWAPSTAYVVGDRRTNATRAYRCITAGTSAGSGGPTTTSADETDGTVHWRYLGDGVAAVDVDGRAKDTGPKAAVSGDVKVIGTPVSGWKGVINVLDATVGRDVETNAELRIRRERELGVQGASIADAIRAELLKVKDVTHVTVFFNNTDVTDADMVPPHSVECLVAGGADQDIRDQLLASVAAGIRTHGSVSGTAKDSQGTAHTMKFSRPTDVLIYVDVILIKDPTKYPANGDNLVKTEIVNRANKVQVIGQDVVGSRIAGWAFVADSTGASTIGILDVNDVDIGTAPAPTLGTTIPITSRQIAKFDTSRITVATSDGTP